MARVAMVTGARRGIGRAIAIALASAGCDIVVADISAAGSADTQRSVEAKGRQCEFLALDVADPGRLGVTLAALAPAFRKIDILVNNAGLNTGRNWADITADDWERTYAVNVQGPFFLSRELGRAMAERRWGRIVNIGSLAMVGAGDGCMAYSSSKAALAALTRALAAQLGQFGVTVNAVAPGVVETEWVMAHLTRERLEESAARNPTRRNGLPADIATVVAFLASDDAGFINGQTLHVNGGAWMA